MKTIIASTIALAVSSFLGAPVAYAGQDSDITIRTEHYPRPPYSGATYYIYERNGAVICTKLKVCNKYDNCNVTYKLGSYKDQEDIETGEPYGTTEAVVIPTSKQVKHVCLTRFKLNDR